MALSYTFLQADAGKAVRLRVTAMKSGVADVIATSAAVTVAAVGGDPYAGVDAATMAQRQSIVNEFNSSWPGYTGQTFAQAPTLVTSLTNLDAAFRALPRSDLTAWYCIELDSTVTDWTAGGELTAYQTTAPEGVVTAGHWFGSTWDRASNGGGVLIRSSNPAIPVPLQGTLSVRGVRGVEFQNVNFCKVATGTSNTERDGAQNLVLVSASNRPESTVLRVVNCGIGQGFHPTVTDRLRSPVGIVVQGTGRSGATPISGVPEQLDIINCRFNGVQTGFSSTGVRRIRTHGNDFRGVLGDAMIPLHTGYIADINSAYDERVIWWSRLNTMRDMGDFATLYPEHTDYAQNGTSSDVGNYSVLHEFEVFQGKRVTGSDAADLTFSALPTDGSSVTISGTTFTFVAASPTGNQVLIGGTISATMDNLIAAIAAANLTTIVRAYRVNTITTRVGFVYDQWTPMTRSTSPASNITVGSPIRYAGGVQGLYKDDLGASFSMTYIAINCIMGSNAGLASRMYNGTAIIDRSTAVRAGALPPDAVLGVAGFTYTYDFAPYITSARKTTAAVINHTVRNSVIDNVQDRPTSGEPGTATRRADGTYTNTNSTLVMANNRYPSWDKASVSPNRPQDFFSGTFTTDANGKFSYVVNDDGTDTQSQYRTNMYNFFRLANTTDRAAIGPTDPSTWPAI